MELSLALEATEEDAGNLSQTAQGTAVHFMAKKDKQHPKRDKLLCYCCGKSNHKANECRFKMYSCNTCDVKGHLAKMCRNSKKFIAKNALEPSNTKKKSDR